MSTDPLKLSRRMAALMGAGGAAGLLAGQAKADTAFTSFAFADVLGSTPRTDPQRWGDVYNVKSFGARGDGLSTPTSDDLAIQAAINAAGPGGGTVFFPPGTYILNAPLIPPPAFGNVVYLQGGPAQLKGNFPDFLIKNNPSAPGQGTIFGIRDFVLSNNYRDPANGFNVNTGCIYTDNTNGMAINNIKFAAGWNFIVYGSANCFDCVIQDCVGSLPVIGTIGGGGPIGILGGASTTIVQCGFLGGYCGFMIGGGVSPTAAGGMTRMIGTRTEACYIGVYAGAHVSSGGVLSASQVSGFTSIGHQSERCNIGMIAQAISAGFISSAQFTGQSGPQVAQGSAISFTGDGTTATCTFVGPTLDSNGWTTGQSRRVVVQNAPAGYNTPGPGGAGAVATYASPNSFTYPATGTASVTGGVTCQWSFSLVSGFRAANVSETVIAGMICSFNGVLSENNIPSPGIDLFYQNYTTGKGTFDGSNNLLIGVTASATGWAMPPINSLASSGKSGKAGTQYIMCDQPTGSTLDVYGHAAGMVFAELPNNTTTISLEPLVEGMEYDIIDVRVFTAPGNSRAVNSTDWGKIKGAATDGSQWSGGGTGVTAGHAHVRYNGTDWTIMGI